MERKAERFGEETIENIEEPFLIGSKNKRGVFVVFEGIDKSGKKTHLANLARHILYTQGDCEFLITHEPRDERIFRMLREDTEPYSHALEMLKILIKDDRIPHTKNLIKPVLEYGVCVLCNRYRMSTDAYQWAQGINLPDILMLQENPDILSPDLTFLLDLPVETALSRINGRYEKFEKKFFLETVRRNYLSLCERFNSRTEKRPRYGKIEIIDARRSIPEVSEDICNRFDSFCKEQIKS